MTDFSRREILSLAIVSPVMAAASQPQNQLDKRSFLQATSQVVSDPQSKHHVELLREWNGSLCGSRLVNRGQTATRVKEVVLFDLTLPFPAATRIYGEGFQMLSQTGGTLGQPVDYSIYTDAKHYRMPIPAGARAFYGMLRLTPPDGENRLLAFTSCRRFNGQFFLHDSQLRVVVDTEGIEIAPGQSVELEDFTFISGKDHEQLLEELARRLNQNHPRLQFAKPPTGWCSWYCFGPRVTAQQVLENLDVIAKQAPLLKYIQIDDGYQPAMGEIAEDEFRFHATAIYASGVECCCQAMI